MHTYDSLYVRVSRYIFGLYVCPRAHVRVCAYLHMCVCVYVYVYVYVYVCVYVYVHVCANVNVCQWVAACGSRSE